MFLEKNSLSSEMIDFKKLSWDNERDVDPRFGKEETQISKRNIY